MKIYINMEIYEKIISYSFKFEQKERLDVLKILDLLNRLRDPCDSLMGVVYELDINSLYVIDSEVSLYKVSLKGLSDFLEFPTVISFLDKLEIPYIIEENSVETYLNKCRLRQFSEYGKIESLTLILNYEYPYTLMVTTERGRLILLETMEVDGESKLTINKLNEDKARRFWYLDKFTFELFQHYTENEDGEAIYKLIKIYIDTQPSVTEGNIEDLNKIKEAREKLLG